MGMSTGGGGEAGATPHINVTPLIDILLVLLIIFMAITPLKPSRFEAKVPAEPKDQPQVNVKPNPLTLVIAINKDTNEIERTVFIKSPKSVRYGDVVKVIDAAKEAGASPIGLQIDDLQD